MVKVILVSHHISNGLVERFKGAMQAILEQIEYRAYGFAVMIKSVVDDQNQVLARVGGEQVLQKSDEGIAVFAVGGGVGDVRTVPVVSAKDVRC